MTQTFDADAWLQDLQAPRAPSPRVAQASVPTQQTAAVVSYAPQQAATPQGTSASGFDADAWLKDLTPAAPSTPVAPTTPAADPGAEFVASFDEPPSHVDIDGPGVPELPAQPLPGGSLVRGWNMSMQGVAMLRSQLPFTYGKMTPEEAAAYIQEKQKSSADFPPDPERAALDEALGAIDRKQGTLAQWGDMASAIAHHIGAFPGVLGESLGSSVAGMVAPQVGSVAGAAVGGPVGSAAGALGGIASGSFASDMLASLPGELEKVGVDLNDPKAVAQKLKDPDFMRAAIAGTAKHAGAVAGVDTVTAGLLGRWLGRVDRIMETAASRAAARAGANEALAGTIGHHFTKGASKALEGLGEAGTEAGGEALGELAQDGTIDPVNVGLEGLAGAGPKVIQGAIFNKALSRVSDRASGKNVASTVSDLPDDLDFDRAAQGPGGLAPEPGAPNPATVAWRSGMQMGVVDKGTKNGSVRLSNNIADLDAEVSRRGSDNADLVAVAPGDPDLTAGDAEEVFYVGNNEPERLEAATRFVGPTADAARKKLAEAFDIYNSAPEIAGQTSDGRVLEQQIDRAVALYHDAVQLGARVDPTIGDGPTMFAGDLDRVRVRGQIVQDPMFTMVGPIEKAALTTDDGKPFEPVHVGSTPSQGRHYDIDLAHVPEGSLAPSLPDIFRAIGYDQDKLLPFIRDNFALPDDMTVEDVFGEVNKAATSDPTYVRLLQKGLVYTGSKEIYRRGGEPVVLKALPVRALVPYIGEIPPSFQVPRNTLLAGDTTKNRVGPEGEVTADLGQPSGLLFPDAGTKEAFTAGVKIISRLQKAFGIKTALTIGVVNGDVTSNNLSEEVRDQLKPTWNGVCFPFRNTIVINTGKGLSPAKMYETLAHEYGHFVAVTALRNAPAHIRAGVYSAYRRFRNGISQMGMSYNDALRRRNPPSSMLTFGLESQGSFDEVYDPNYMWGFEEWFAEQVARWSVTSERAVSPLTKWFRNLGNKIKQVLSRVQHMDPQQFRAEPEVRDWLDSFIDDVATFGEEVMREGDIVSTSDNARVMPDPMNAAPAQAETAKLVMMMSKNPGAAAGLNSLLLANHDKWVRGWKWLGTLSVVAKKNPFVAELQRYKGLIDSAVMDMGRIVSAAEKRMVEWKNLGASQAEAVSRLIFDADSMSYLTPQERVQGIVRWPTAQELGVMARKHGINRAGINVYAGIKQDFLDMLDRYEVALTAEAQRAPAAQRAAKVANVQATFKQLRQKPYFPHMGFGKYTVTVRMPNGQVHSFERLETERQVKVRADELRQKYPTWKDIREGLLPDSVNQFLGVPQAVIQKVLDDMPGMLTQDQRHWLEELRYERAPAQSGAKRFMRRKNVNGFSTDAQRTYASYFMSASKHYMRVKYFQPLRAQVNMADRNQKALLKGVKRGKIRDFMDDHLTEFTSPSMDASRLKALAFHFHLGFNAASAFINTTQTVMVTWPYLSTKYGNIGATAAMKRAAINVKNMYRQETLDKMSEPEFQALGEAVRRGWINEAGQAVGLAGIASGGNLKLVNGTGFETAINWLAHKSAAMFSATETWNRRVAFRAAYNLAKTNPTAKHHSALVLENQDLYDELLNDGFPHDEAVALLSGRDSIDSTQFNYAKHNRPRYMRGSKAIALQFFMFTHSTLSMLGNNPGVIPGYLLLMTLIGGFQGWPGEEDANDLIKGVAWKLLGKDWDPNREIQSFINRVTGEDWVGDVFMHGASKYGFGANAVASYFGLPNMPSFDISRSVGMGHISPVPFSAIFPGPGKDIADATNDISQGVAGAAMAPFFGMFKAMNDDQLAPTDPKRWEAAMPKVLRNLSQAWRYASEGEERTRTGAEVAPFDMRDTSHIAEVVGRAAGFTPSRVTDTYGRQSAMRELDAYWTTSRGVLLTQYDMAVRNNNKDDTADVIAAIGRFNKDVPTAKYAITNKTLKRSVSSRTNARNNYEAGNAKVAAKLEPYMEEINSRFPMAVEARQVTAPKAK